MAEARAEVEVMSLEAARQEAVVARRERELAEAVAPLLVTEEEQVRAFIIAPVYMADPYRSRWSSASPRSRQQHAAAEATTETISQRELLERVSPRRTGLLPQRCAQPGTLIFSRSLLRSLSSLHLYKLVNSDACPRPTAPDVTFAHLRPLRAQAPQRRAHAGRPPSRGWWSWTTLARCRTRWSPCAPCARSGCALSDASGPFAGDLLAGGIGSYPGAC